MRWAKRNATRNFEQAAANHYLKTDKGKWMTKKQWDELQGDKENENK